MDCKAWRDFAAPCWVHICVGDGRFPPLWLQYGLLIPATGAPHRAACAAKCWPVRWKHHGVCEHQQLWRQRKHVRQDLQGRIKTAQPLSSSFAGLAALKWQICYEKPQFSVATCASLKWQCQPVRLTWSNAGGFDGAITLATSLHHRRRIGPTETIKPRHGRAVMLFCCS